MIADDMLQISHEWTCAERKRVGFTFVSYVLEIVRGGELDQFDVSCLEHAQMVLAGDPAELLEINREAILEAYLAIRTKWRTPGQRTREPPVTPLRRLFRAIVGIRS